MWGFKMKIKKIILISTLLLILTLGAVSASDNAVISDNITSSQVTDIISDEDDDFIDYEFGTGTENPNVEVCWPTEIRVGENVDITFNLPDDMRSKVLLFVDNQRYDDGQDANTTMPYSVFIDDFGTTTLKFQFYGDSKYAPIAMEKSYNVNDFIFDAYALDENIVYGQETSLLIDFPFDATGNILVNGESHPIGVDDYYLNVPLKNLQLGTNQIKVTYLGDEKYHQKTVYANVNVDVGVIYATSMPFDNVTFLLMLPGNPSGSLEVCVDANNTKTSECINGIAQIKFDDLALGNHTFKARYIGDAYSFDNEGQFEVTPNISIDSFKTTFDQNDVEITLPKGEAGNFEITLIRHLEINLVGLTYTVASRSMDVNTYKKVSFSTLGHGYYTYNIRYRSERGYVYQKTYEGFIRNDFKMNITSPDVVLANGECVVIGIDSLSVSDGYMELFVDGNLYDVTECEDTSSIYFFIDEGLSLGNHTLTVKFSGNNEYSPLEKSFGITSKYLIFDVPEEILIGTDDVIYVNALANVVGNLVVYVDGVEFAKEAIEDGLASISMSKMPFKPSDITVAYENGNYPAVRETHSLNVSYTIDMGGESISYAGENLFTIDLPNGLPADKLIVKIDDVEYSLINDGGEVGINISELEMGEHRISVYYPGDDTFYPISIEKTINVGGKVTVPEETKFGQDNNISLVLPQNPEGELIISEYVPGLHDYSVIARVGFKSHGENSIAEIPISILGLGEHKIKVSYSGSDYAIPEQILDISLDLDLRYESNIEYANKSTMDVYLPGAKGSVELYIDGDYLDAADFEDGIAKVDLSSLDVGMHYFSLEYDGDISFCREGEILVYPKIDVPSTVIDGGNSIVIASGYDAVGSVVVYCDGKQFKEVDLYGGKQTISLSDLSNGVHNISIFYDSWDMMSYDANYTLTVKKASLTAKDMSMDYLDGSKFKVLVKDYNGKAVGKGQAVKFYVGGKLFATAKTDAKGYASIVLTHVPKTYSVKVVYKATTITKKVTVKQVMTFKKVAVKRSAKKLVLTATLKKVKGKYLKNKQITFKFNGKNYKVFTNSKGVAKLTILPKVLKKLKVGKSITYQATYVKTTIKQTVKVSK